MASVQAQRPQVTQGPAAAAEAAAALPLTLSQLLAAVAELVF